MIILLKYCYKHIKRNHRIVKSVIKWHILDDLGTNGNAIMSVYLIKYIEILPFRYH